MRFHFSTVGSTNLWASKNYALFDRGGINIVTADKQTGGYGKEKRVWVSPAKVNLYASFCFFLPKNEQNIINLAQIFSLSLCKTLEKMGFNPRIKWPNDILLNGRKLAGVLVEIKDLSTEYLAIIGVGLNVNSSPNQLQVVNQKATSLLIESGDNYDKELILETLHRSFTKDLDRYRKKCFAPFLKDYQKRLIHKADEDIAATTKAGDLFIKEKSI